MTTPEQPDLIGGGFFFNAETKKPRPCWLGSQLKVAGPAVFTTPVSMLEEARRKKEQEEESKTRTLVEQAAEITRLKAELKLKDEQIERWRTSYERTETAYLALLHEFVKVDKALRELEALLARKC